ncbi:uncharacterized protein FYW61_019452 isoform 1-T1 [Anableps anableps]
MEELMCCCLFSSVSSHREKMISRILLLIILNSCLCAATFRVNVAQSCYQAEENHSITLEWTFTTTPHGSSRELFILCSLLVPPRELTLYQVHEGVEVPESQDEEFSGRVQTDKDVLREGRIRLHVSRLRTEDSGLYVCEVTTEDGSGSGRCQLSVSAGSKQPEAEIKPQITTSSPEVKPQNRKSQGSDELFIGLLVFMKVMLFVAFYRFTLHFEVMIFFSFD